MKKLIALFLSILFVLLVGCSPIGEVSESIFPPKPSGELYDIQKTLEASVGHGVNLVYPSSGQYRSAIITKDIDFDGEFEVFSFYSTETDDKTTVMHVNYIRRVDGKWESVTDLQVDCSGVESVEFVKLDDGPSTKMVVSWDRYSSLNRQLSVYSIDSGDLVEIAGAGYSVYSTCDFDLDGVFEIVAVSLDTETKNASATLLSLHSGGFTGLSGCGLDGSVTSYYKPVVSKFTDGTTALFIDANKSTGMITEVLYVKDGQLLSAIPYNANNENLNTLRQSLVRSGDYDRDGCVDIPLAQKLPMAYAASPEDAAYTTVWHSFDGIALYPIAHSVINYTDGYFLHLPDNWIGSLALERRLDTRHRIFYRWDPVLLEVGEEVMRVQAVKIKDWDKANHTDDGYFEVCRNGEDVIAVKLGTSAMTPTEEFIKLNLNLISENERNAIQTNKK